MATTLTLALSGVANHHPVLVTGTGTLEPGRVALDLRVDAEAMDLDPVLLVLAGIDPLLAIAGGAVAAPADEPIVVRGRVDVVGQGPAARRVVDAQTDPGCRGCRAHPVGAGRRLGGWFLVEAAVTNQPHSDSDSKRDWRSCLGSELF